MAFTPVEIIALILIIFSAIKVIVLLISPKSWMGFAKNVWSNTPLLIIVCTVLAIAVFYYLIQEITIIQILATTAFVALVVAIGMAGQIEDLLRKYERRIKTKSLWKGGVWIYTLIWLALLIWGVIELIG